MTMVLFALIVSSCNNNKATNQQAKTENCCKDGAKHEKCQEFAKEIEEVKQVFDNWEKAAEAEKIAAVTLCVSRELSYENSDNIHSSRGLCLRLPH